MRGAALLGRVCLSADGCLGLRQRFTGIDTLVPRVIKLVVTTASTVSEPSTTATAATNFPGFCDDPTFGAYGTNSRRGGGPCGVHVIIDRNAKSKTRK